MCKFISETSEREAVKKAISRERHIRLEKGFAGAVVIFKLWGDQWWLIACSSEFYVYVVK